MTALLQAGDLLAKKYRIEGPLGVGGMGVVFAAHHLALDQRVAIKVLLPEMLSNPDAISRFIREARAAVRIQSEHVARIWDVGAREDGTPYIVMEFLEGEDLGAWLRARGPLTVTQAVEFVLQACEAIAEAHALGIVHRDLKPSNLFVIRRADGLFSVKVLDFGIAKVRNASASALDQSVTNPSALIGSPRYMSPEQLQHPLDTDLRCDIWALGVLSYELLTGECPFEHETLAGLVAKIVSMPPPPLRDRLPALPEGLEGVIFKCLERDRSRRYASIAELACAFAPFGTARARTSVECILGVQGVALSPSSAGIEAEGSRTLAVTVAPVGVASSGKASRHHGALGLALGCFGLFLLLAVCWSVFATPPVATVVNLEPASLSVAPHASTLVVKPPTVAGPEQPKVAFSSQPPQKPVAPRRKGLTTKAISPPKPAAKKTNCTPNFYFDAHGDKHFKPECF